MHYIRDEHGDEALTLPMVSVLSVWFAIVNENQQHGSTLTCSSVSASFALDAKSAIQIHPEPCFSSALGKI